MNMSSNNVQVFCGSFATWFSKFNKLEECYRQVILESYLDKKDKSRNE